jgi:hypothetical protein
MAEKEQPRAEWVGHDLFDLDGDKIGTVEDVRYGDYAGAPTWLVVETGFLGRKKILVPAGEVRRAADRLSVPFTKERVKDSPEVEDYSALTDAETGKLCRYYGLQYAPWAGRPGDGCDEIDKQDTRAAG